MVFLLIIKPILVCRVSFFLNQYKFSFQGHTQKMLNISILQTLTWIASVALCIVCMFQSITAALTSLIILIFSRPMLVAGSQALIATA